MGSRANEWVDWTRTFLGVELRPWQVQVGQRALEIDRDGLWCWQAGVVISVPRQCGKSLLVLSLAGWLASTGDLVLGTSNRLRTAAEFLRPLGLKAADAGGRYRLTADQPGVDLPGGGRLVMQACNSGLGVGWSPRACFVDEAWDVPRHAVTDGLLPAMVASPNPLLLMASTIGDESDVAALTLYRGLARNGGAVCLAEWSCNEGDDHLDEQVWREASPHWDPARLRRLRAEVQTRSESEFRMAFLNEPRSRPDGWVSKGTWQAAAMPTGTVLEHPEVAAFEVTLDGSHVYCVAAGWHGDGQILVQVHRFADAIQANRWLTATRPAMVLAPRVFTNRLSRIDRVVGSTELTSGMPAFRQCLDADRLRHIEDPSLTDPLLLAQQVVTRTGRQALATPDGRSLSAVRCLVWAVAEMTQTARPGKPRFRSLRAVG